MSDLLKRISAAKQEALNTGEQHGFQKACDFISMALNDPVVMGAKNVISGEKIDLIIHYAIELSHAFDPAFRPATDVEADYYQEKLDERQRKIFKDKFVPFYERYSWLKKVTYR